MEKKEKPKDVTGYIAAAPRELQGRLREIRRAIRQVAPKAEEKLSYGMPYYGYKGRLAYFMRATNHIGLYIPTPVIADHARELKGYETSKATLRLPHDRKLPVTLIKKLVRARLKLNEAGKKNKSLK